MMGFFDFLKPKGDLSVNKGFPAQDNVNDQRKAECPYCQSPLAKIPSRKTKCPYCKNFLYVCTKPSTNTRVVVTQEESEKIEAEWKKINVKERMRDFFTDKEFDNEVKRREVIKEKGSRVSFREDDIIWTIMNGKANEYKIAGESGLYRNVRHQQAEFLILENRYEHALHFLLTTLFLDLSIDYDILDLKSIFDEEEDNDDDLSFLAPALHYGIKEMQEKLNLTEEELKKKFIVVAELEKRFKSPSTPEEIWKIYTSLNKKADERIKGIQKKRDGIENILSSIKDIPKETEPTREELQTICNPLKDNSYNLWHFRDVGNELAKRKDKTSHEMAWLLYNEALTRRKEENGNLDTIYDKMAKLRKKEKRYGEALELYCFVLGECKKETILKEVRTCLEKLEIDIDADLVFKKVYRKSQSKISKYIQELINRHVR